MFKFYAIPLLYLVVFSHLHLMAGWLERKAEGWAWYEDVEKLEKKEEVKPMVEISPPPSLSAADKALQVRKELEEKLAQAVLEPTKENVENYMREQQKWINQSARFSSIWAKILLQHPGLDSTITFPTSQYGIQLSKQLQRERRTSLIRQLISQYGLFFFYEGKNQTSQALALVVQEFAKKYGWEIIAISKDGFLLEGFADNHPDNGIIKNLQIETIPSLFLVNPHKADIKPIAFGLASLDQIESNIETHFSEGIE